MTIEEMKKIAELSKLEFSDEEMQQLMSEFDKIDAVIQSVLSVDVKGVEYKIPIKEYCELREDEVAPSYSREEILKNAPKKDSISFILPKVVE